MAKALVVYYSRKGENHMPGGIQVLPKGHTAYAAEYIRDALDADLFEIDTVTPYAENYRECCMQAVAELKVFFGDSITQGHQTVAKMDVFGHDVVIFLCDVIMTEIPVVADAESVELIDQIHN